MIYDFKFMIGDLFRCEACFRFFFGDVQFEQHVLDDALLGCFLLDGLQQTHGVHRLNQVRTQSDEVPHFVGLQVSDEMPVYIVGQQRLFALQFLHPAFTKVPFSRFIRFAYRFHGLKLTHAHQRHLSRYMRTDGLYVLSNCHGLLYRVQNIHNRTLGNRDEFAVVGVHGLFECKHGIVQRVGLNEHGYALAGLFLTVNGDHLHSGFVPIGTAFVGEHFKKLAAFAGLYLAVAENERLDLFHQAVLCVCKTNCAVNEINLFYLARVVFSRLALIMYFNLVKNHMLYN